MLLYCILLLNVYIYIEIAFVYSFSIYGFWLSLWYLQTFLDSLFLYFLLFILSHKRYLFMYILPCTIMTVIISYADRSKICNYNVSCLQFLQLLHFLKIIACKSYIVNVLCSYQKETNIFDDPVTIWYVIYCS